MQYVILAIQAIFGLIDVKGNDCLNLYITSKPMYSEGQRMIYTGTEPTKHIAI